MHTPRLLDAVRRVDTRARQIMERLASGLRVNTLGDDGGAQVSIDLLNADTRSLAMTLVNINGGISLGTVAQDGLDRVASLLDQMATLAEQASVTYLGSQERAVLNSQYVDYRDQIETIALNLEYDNIKLLDGSMGGGVAAEPAVVTAPVAQTTTLAVDETFTFADFGLFSGMSAAERTITFDGYVAAVLAEAAEVSAPVAQTTTLAVDETFTFADFGLFSGMSAAERTITFDGYVAPAPAEPAVVTAATAQTQGLKKAEVLEFEDYGIFTGMTQTQRQISFAQNTTQTQVVNAINADSDISPLVTASVDGSGQLVLTSVATGSATTFRVFSDQKSASNQTGIGKTSLEGTGVDAITESLGLTQTEVVNAINGDADISPLITASVNGSGELVLTSVATGAAAEFRVQSDVAAANDSTGLGTSPLEDAGVDGAPADPGLTQTEVVNAINGDPDISPLITASVNGAGQLVLRSVATGASIEFRVQSDVVAANDSTGFGTTSQEDAGVDAQEGTGGLEVQAHIHHDPPDSTISISINPVTLDALGLTGSTIETLTNAVTAVTAVASAEEEVVRVTGQVDALVSRLAFAANTALSGQAETHKAILRIQSVDDVQETLAMAVVQIVQQSSKAMLAQANITPQMALSLL